MINVDEIFRDLLGKETDQYLSASKSFLESVSGETIAWMKMTGLRYELYVYSKEAGDAVAETLLSLGVKKAVCIKEYHWHDGEYYLVKGSI